MAGEQHKKSCIESSHDVFDKIECKQSLLTVRDDYLNNICINSKY